MDKRLTNGSAETASRLQRLPFFYGWVIVADCLRHDGDRREHAHVVLFLYPSILDEFDWDRGLAAGAFSFGFLVSAALSPFVGLLMDRTGRASDRDGRRADGGGLLLATTSRALATLFTLGVLVGAGANCTSYSAQSLFLAALVRPPARPRPGLAFSGVGVGSIVLLPWLQSIIQREGWRASCWTMGILALLVLGPINLFIWRRPRISDCSPTAPCADRRERGANGRQCRRSRLGGNRMDAGPRACDVTVLVDRQSDISARFSPGTRCRCIRPSI